jgi:hypothetical protein
LFPLCWQTPAVQTPVVQSDPSEHGLPAMARHVLVLGEQIPLAQSVGRTHAAPAPATHVPLTHVPTEQSTFAAHGRPRPLFWHIPGEPCVLQTFVEQSGPNQQGWEAFDWVHTLRPLLGSGAQAPVVQSLPAAHDWPATARHLPVAVEQAPLAQSALEVHAPPGLKPQVPAAEHTLLAPHAAPADPNCPVVADTSVQLSVPFVQKPTPA